MAEHYDLRTKQQLNETEEPTGRRHFHEAIEGDHGEFDIWAEARAEFERAIKCAKEIKSHGLEVQLTVNLSIKIKDSDSSAPTAPLH